MLGTALLTVALCEACSGPRVDSQQLLGTSELTLREVYYRDFLGLSTHGELFDFQELAVADGQTAAIIHRPAFQHFPSYGVFKNFYGDKLRKPDSVHWQRTPISFGARKPFTTILGYGNLLDDKHSQQLLQAHYLNEPGNFYAYFTGYPAGTVLYILAPAENRLFIIRKRG